MTDIVELILQELNCDRVMYRLQIPNLYGNTGMSFHDKMTRSTYLTIEDHVVYLQNRADKLQGKDLKKNLQEWAVDLNMSARFQRLRDDPMSAGADVGKRKFSRAIINAFKKLPR